MVTLTGRCYCDAVQYSVTVDSLDDLRTSLCHCRRFFGGPFGTTTKTPLKALKFTQGQDKIKKHVSGHEGETELTREFCVDCGTCILEFAARAKDEFRYLNWGTFDECEQVNPKGEFFCGERASWMLEIPGIFHKDKINR
ncbi:hypothetical protein ACM66B_004542 [Microbotryomycetes sp. NB124-2]